MKIRHKKLIASGIALSLAGVLGAGALLQTSVSVQASYAMMPGIEQIVKDTSEEKPFKILEIVDNTNEAEIGYYVSGQEPYVKLYKYTYKYKDKTTNEEKTKTIQFSSLKEGLEKLPTETLRKEFATNMKTATDGPLSDTDTGIKNIQSSSYQAGSTDAEENYPLSYSQYQEKYFLSDSDDTEKWQKINFQKIDDNGNSRTDTVEIKGNYRENTAGTGDYTKQEQQYYPIRQDDNDDKAKPEKYRENIQNFYYADNNTADAPYFLEFQEVDNNIVNQSFDTNHNKINNNSILNEYDYSNGNYGYYENVYSDLTEEIVQNIQNGNYTFPGENPTLSSEDKELAVKIPDSTNTRAANAKSFSDGNDEFSSINEADADNTVDANTQADTQPDVSSDGSQASQPADSFSADTFSTGDFSDGISDSADGDIEDGDNSQTYVADSASADTDFNSVTDTETDFSADANATVQADADSAQDAMSVENDDIQPIINYSEKKDKNGNVIKNEAGITELDAIGTSANPKVYYGVTIDQYPYYKYTLISDMKKIVACANANADAVQNGTFTPIQATTSGEREKNITFQDNQYWYWTVDENGNTAKNPISIVTQRQPVSYEDIREIPTTLLGYNYYYKVSQAYFCCKKSDSSEDSSAGTGEQLPYRYFGWYVPSYPQNQDVYIPVVENDGKTATHYISDAEYKLTPGIGNYDFIPDDTALPQKVEVNHMYYQGGYTNHDWFKQYVFHLEPGEAGSDAREQFDAFKIEVTTITTQKFNEQFGSADETASVVSGDSDATEITGDGDSTGSNHLSADDSVNSDDAQADNSQTDDIQSGEVQTDNTSDDQNTDTQDANETQTEAPATAQNEGDTSEVDPMVSEAGVELVSIEKEFSDSTDNEDDQENSFQDGTENEVMPEAESSSDESFSAGDTDSDSGKTKLEDYDLIYLNGTGLNESSYQKILDIVSPQKSKKKPCIINQTKLQNNVTFKSSFESIINDNDRDGHYVNCNVYFFKNNFLPDDQDNGSLLNVSFDKNFNPAYTEEPDSFSDGNSLMEGFEEILKYIKKENKYRKIKENSTNKDNTENQEEKENTPLSTKISQARAIEYIINYRLKRNDLPTGKIRVLELQPARSQGEITGSQVLRWLGHEMTVQSCCTKDSYPVENVLSGSNNAWYSDYTRTTERHWLQISFTNLENIDGFIYKAISDKDRYDGILYEYTLELYDEEGKLLYKSTPGIHINYSSVKKGSFDRKRQTINFLTTVHNVKTMKLFFDNTFSDTGYNNRQYASAREFLPIFHDENTKVEITTMTTSEFVGHIDDLNTKYDMIYLGDDAEDLNYSGNFRPDDNVLYYHVGGNKLARYELQGLMNHDYVTKGSQKTAATVGDKDSTTGTTIGSVRGSGNDITKEIKNKLVNFAKSGYPVVVAGNIYGENKKTISTTLVDNSSYIYDFLNEVKGFDNVYKEGEITADEDINFYAELPKPKIELKSSPPSAIETGDGSSRKFLTGENMTFQFQIIDEAQASPANAEYNCELYIDLNCDGNFSNAEKLEDIAVMQNGNVIQPDNDGTYHLSLNTDYTVSRKIPQEYIKLMPWKLVVTNNNNSEIRTSEIGYTKRENTNSTANTINVLQIIPNSACTWNLARDTVFQNLLKNVDDFQVNITTITVGQYETQYTNGTEDLNQYHMLIVGFCDGAAYGAGIASYSGANPTNFSAKGAQKILEFANSGKSVILAHDNTSSSNYAHDAENKTGNDPTWKGWAYYFNQKLRVASGMDRYGITNPLISGILKEAKILNKSSLTEWNEVLKNAGDMAYSLNSNKNNTYSETQGFTNGKLRVANTTRETQNTEATTKASQVNEGAITEYPYKIDKTITVAATHFQYYQLALEENADEDDSGDLVVWYCLGDKDNKNGDGYYDHSPNDVRNNYYIYSYKNIIYTGVGHSNVQNNNNNLMEKKLFVNTIIAAYNAGTNTKDLKLQLYIESDDGKKVKGIGGENTKVKEIHLPVYKAGTEQNKHEDGYIYVNSGNVYDFTLNDLPAYENYLKTNAGYKGKVTLYAKISCKYIYYGTEKEAQSVAQVNICQRQLFDLD